MPADEFALEDGKLPQMILVNMEVQTEKRVFSQIALLGFGGNDQHFIFCQEMNWHVYILQNKCSETY